MLFRLARMVPCLKNRHAPGNDIQAARLLAHKQARARKLRSQIERIQHPFELVLSRAEVLDLTGKVLHPGPRAGEVADERGKDDLVL